LKGFERFFLRNQKWLDYFSFLKIFINYYKIYFSNDYRAKYIFFSKKSKYVFLGIFDFFLKKSFILFYL